MNAYRTCPKIIGLINTDSKISKIFIVSYEDEEYSDENGLPARVPWFVGKLATN